MVSDHRSTHRNFRDLRRVVEAIELAVYPRGAVSSRKKNKIFDKHCCFLVRLHCSSAEITFVGVLDTLKVSDAAEFKSFLLKMCIAALETTTNSLSSGLILDGARRTKHPKARRTALF